MSTNPNEQRLIAEFSEQRCDEAFEALVRLHANLVFSTAMRQVGNRALAEEVTQTVFLALADKAHALKPGGTLAGWLYRTTINQARQCLRAELRRVKREQVAQQLATIERDGESPAATIAPLLDEALLHLSENDRLAVVLHYFEQRPLREVGQALGVGEDAARKRLHRVTEALCRWFRRRGFAVSGPALVPVLSNAHVAPAALISAILSAANLQLSASSVAATVIVMTTAKKLALAGAALALGLVVVTTSYLKGESRRTDRLQSTPGTPATGMAIDDPVAQSSPAERESSTGKAPSPAPPRPSKGFYERLNEGDMALTMLPRAAAEDYLARNKTNAQSLIGAYRVTHDLAYLRHAAEKFPHDPAVLLRVVAHDAFPENRGAWIEQFKAADSSNSLPWCLSAADHLKRNEFELAIQDLEHAAQTPQFQDYVTEHMLTLEEMYLAGGHSAAEAKALGMSAVELPYLTQMGEVSNALSDQLKGYILAGDSASASRVAAAGLKLADTFNRIQDGGNLLGEMMASVMEQRILRQLDPSTEYPFLTGSIPDRMALVQAREREIRESGNLFSSWITRASEPEIISYFDRLKLYGEAGALEWLKGRVNP